MKPVVQIQLTGKNVATLALSTLFVLVGLVMVWLVFGSAPAVILGFVLLLMVRGFLGLFTTD